MVDVVLRGGTVLDASGARRADVAVAAGRVVAVGPGLAGPTVLDASGCWVTPGLVDIHVHLREPGGEDAETLHSGARAAARGGVTAVVAMPNTTPCTDSVEAVRDVQRRAAGAVCDIRVAAAVTRGRDGRELVDVDALHAAGVRVFTDDGDVIADARLLREALQRLRPLPGAVLAEHAEDADLVAGGAVNEGPVATRLGVGGRPAVAEEVIVARDVALARTTGGRLHVLHASTARTVALVARARAEGVAVTCEVTPQHLVLTEDDVPGLGGLGRVNPPLRSHQDRDALRAAVAAGVVDAIATDHAPHAPATKARPLADTPPGMTGLETALAVVLTDLVRPGLLTAQDALALLSWRPAALAGVDGHGGPVAVGAPAHLAVVDPAVRWTVDPGDTASRSSNTPFAGRELTGRVRHTLLHGEPVVVDGVPQR